MYYTKKQMHDCFKAGADFARDMFNNPSNSEYISTVYPAIKTNSVEDIDYAMTFIEHLRSEMIEYDVIEKAIEEIKIKEAEKQEQNSLGDAWEGGFADNH